MSEWMRIMYFTGGVSCAVRGPHRAPSQEGRSWHRRLDIVPRVCVGVRSPWAACREPVVGSDYVMTRTLRITYPTKETAMTSTTLQYATSKDGTTIAYDRLGTGPAVVLVSGGSVDRSSNAGLADQLATGYTVFNYDRRGRGPSGDTQPYAIQREIEDIDAVIEAAGGKAHLYGSSSGAALALLAAAAGSPVDKLALWEPPYIVDESRPKPDPNTAQIYRDLVAQDRRGDAVEYFMAKVVGMPEEFVASASSQPWWQWTESDRKSVV